MGKDAGSKDADPLSMGRTPPKKPRASQVAPETTSSPASPQPKAQYDSKPGTSAVVKDEKPEKAPTKKDKKDKDRKKPRTPQTQMTLKSLTSAIVEKRNLNIQHFITCVSMLGLLFALVEVDRCFVTCVDQTNKDGEKVCVLPAPPPGCGDAVSEALKAMQTISALVGAVLIWRYYVGVALLRAIRNHVENNRPLADSSFSQTGIVVPFLIEELLTFIHVPPGLSFNISIEFKGLIAVYRIEALITLFMFVRMHHIWKSYRDHVFVQHTTKRYASMIHTTPIDSKFVVKAVLEAHPILVIAILFALHVLVAGYFVKIAEAPVQQNLTSYFWNSCWFIVVTMTTTGYGDFTPITHVGRVIAVIAMITGTLLSAILTAAIYTNLSFNSQEFATMNFMNHAKWQDKRKSSAATVIQNLWLHGIRSPRTKRAIKQAHNVRAGFLAWKQMEPHFGKVMKDVVDSTQNIEEAMERVMNRVKRLQHDSVQLRLHQSEVMPPPGSKPVDELEEKKETRSSKDLMLLLSELESQKKLVEQLLRAVIFLSTSRSKDTDSLRQELGAVRSALEAELKAEVS